jgi:rhodanese-related sulfurtransferase
MLKMSKKNEVKEIGLNKLEQLLEYDKNVKLVDVLEHSVYEKEHIKGAISLPLKNLRERVQDFLKKNKTKTDTTIVVYCSGPECTASASAAKILLNQGCKNVLVYKGGMAEYKKANLPLEGSLRGDASIKKYSAFIDHVKNL